MIEFLFTSTFPEYPAIPEEGEVVSVHCYRNSLYTVLEPFRLYTKISLIESSNKDFRPTICH